LQEYGYFCENEGQILVLFTKFSPESGYIPHL
jgi:hypothetical protein